MKHIVANLAWCSTQWKTPTLEGKNFGYVRDGNLPHEGFNFAVNNLRNEKPWNGRQVVYGFIQIKGLLREYYEANNGEGIAFFISRKLPERTQWIVGLYGECEVFSKFEIDKPWEVNIAAPSNRVIAFYPEAYVPFNEQKYLNRISPIGQSIVAYIDDSLANKILNDSIVSHRILLNRDSANHEVKNIVSRLEKLHESLGGIPRAIKLPRRSTKSIKRSTREKQEQEYEEGLRTEITIEVTKRSPALVKRVKERDSYRCQICGFIFKDFYGPPGEGVADCHHLVPVSQLKGLRKTNPGEAITVCANCHRMLHKGVSLIDPEELREQIRNQMRQNKGPFHWF